MPCRDDHHTTDTERPSGPLSLEAPCLTSRCRSTASARPPDEAVAIFTDRRRPRNGGLTSKSRKGRGLFTPRCGSATLPFDCRNSRSKLLNPFAVPDASRLGRRSCAVGDLEYVTNKTLSRDSRNRHQPVRASCAGQRCLGRQGARLRSGRLSRESM